eukprot:6783084-Prymnesium_polylepis.1
MHRSGFRPGHSPANEPMVTVPPTIHPVAGVDCSTPRLGEFGVLAAPPHPGGTVTLGVVLRGPAVRGRLVPAESAGRGIADGRNDADSGRRPRNTGRKCSPSTASATGGGSSAVGG